MAKKQNLSYQDIESALTVFKENDVVAGEVGYEILKAFGKGEADIRRYRDGKGVLARYDGLLIKGLFGYKSVSTTTSLTATLEEMKQDPQVIKAAPKIVAVSDGETILAYDMRERVMRIHLIAFTATSPFSIPCAVWSGSPILMRVLLM